MTPVFSPALNQAIQIADQITRRASASMQWSTWHTWRYFKDHPEDMHQPSRIWDRIYPFATCVGFSTIVAQDLQRTYQKTTGLGHLVNKVQILTSWEINPREPELGEQPRHSVVALLLPEVCLLVDLVFSPILIVIPTGGMFETIPYITMSGRRGKRLFFYDGVKLEMANPKREMVMKDPFRPMTSEEALSALVRPNALKAATGVHVPASKAIIIQGIVRERPIKVPGVQLDVGSWMITTCRLVIDFLHRKLTMQVPLEDWLLKEKNKWRSSIRPSMLQAVNDSVINLVLELDPERCGKDFEERLNIFERIGSCLGLPVAELDKIVASVYEVWEQ
ncbi:MAG: hypothetical protein Q9195_008296 [Heterodermia aff. obscurata]